MIRAVFFDLDDTLADSAPAWRAALNTTFHGLIARYPELREDAVRAAWHAALTPLMDRLDAGALRMAEVRARRWPDTLRLLGLADDALADELDLLLGRTQLELLRLFPDVAVLDLLRGRCHVGIITNGAGDDHPDSQRSKVIRLGLLGRVDSFLASDDAGSRKPDSRIFAQAMATAGVAPHEALYVGDSVGNDVVGANRAGIGSVLLWRTRDPLPELYEDERPAHVVSSLREVPRLVE